MPSLAKLGPVLVSLAILIPLLCLLTRWARRHLSREYAGKPAWLLFLESAGGAALITVFVGGIIASALTGYLNYKIQERQKKREEAAAKAQQERDFRAAWMQARGNLASVDYQEYLKAQREADRASIELLGAYITTLDNLLLVITPKFSAAEQQKRHYRTEYNAAHRAWHAKHVALGGELTYYHSDKPTLFHEWDECGRSVEQYALCASRLVNADHKRSTRRPFCSTERGSAMAAIDHLSEFLRRDPHYLWREWGDPDKLRQMLDHKDRKE